VGLGPGAVALDNTAAGGAAAQVLEPDTHGHPGCGSRAAVGGMAHVVAAAEIAGGCDLGILYQCVAESASVIGTRALLTILTSSIRYQMDEVLVDE
jgi:hypothetical protein